MIYVLSAVAGLLYGAAMGGLKYITLWRKIIKAAPTEKLISNAIYLRMPFDYVINILTFVLLFLVRKMIPLDFTATAIATAIGLSVVGRYFSVRKILGMTGTEERVDD